MLLSSIIIEVPIEVHEHLTTMKTVSPDIP